MNDPILIAQGTDPIYLLPKMANRHGLIAGATGTGKTVTLQTLAENFSARGIPVFMADVKGDLAGMSQVGGNNPKVVERAKRSEERRVGEGGRSLCDWSSDVCSSDLADLPPAENGESSRPYRGCDGHGQNRHIANARGKLQCPRHSCFYGGRERRSRRHEPGGREQSESCRTRKEIGRASCRGRGEITV